MTASAAPATPDVDAMLASARLHQLRSLGFVVRAEGGRLLVKPASGLTAEQRQALADLKAPLLGLLAEEALRSCPSCKQPLDEKRRCWKCFFRRCSCGRSTGSAFIETCTTCQFTEETCP